MYKNSRLPEEVDTEIISKTMPGIEILVKNLNIDQNILG